MCNLFGTIQMDGRTDRNPKGLSVSVFSIVLILLRRCPGGLFYRHSRPHVSLRVFIIFLYLMSLSPCSQSDASRHTQPPSSRLNRCRGTLFIDLLQQTAGCIFGFFVPVSNHLAVFVEQESCQFNMANKPHRIKDI